MKRKAILCYHGPRYTLRRVTGENEIHPAAVRIVQETLDWGLRKLFDPRTSEHQPGHLVVTLVPFAGWTTHDAPPSPDSPSEIPEEGGTGGCAFYDALAQAISLGSAKPDEMPDEEFCDELAISTLHELVHHWQIVTGFMDLHVDPATWHANDAQAEQTAIDLYKELKPAWNPPTPPTSSGGC